jgi:hypothetical protein
MALYTQLLLHYSTSLFPIPLPRLNQSQYSDMDEDIKLEAVELTVTALERFPTHYEVCGEGKEEKKKRQGMTMERDQIINTRI